MPSVTKSQVEVITAVRPRTRKMAEYAKRAEEAGWHGIGILDNQRELYTILTNGVHTLFWSICTWLYTLLSIRNMKTEPEAFFFFWIGDIHIE